MDSRLLLILPLTLVVVGCSDLPGVPYPGSPGYISEHRGHSHGHTPRPPEKVASEPKPATTPTRSGISPYPLATCVVSDEGLGDWDEETTYIHGNQELKFCCKMCLKKFKKDPETYLAKLPVKTDR